MFTNALRATVLLCALLNVGTSAEETWQERTWNQTLTQVRVLAPLDTESKLRLLIRGLEASQVLWRNLPSDAQPGGPGFEGHPFDLDGMRSPDQIVRAGVGGSCGSYAKVLADALVRTGTDPDDVHLVDTVGENQREGATTARTAREAPGSGHCFLLVNDRARGWLLADSTSRTLDAVPFLSPEKLRGRMRRPGYARDPVRVHPARGGEAGAPSFPNLLLRNEIGPDGELIRVGPPEDIFKDLVIFRVARSVDYPIHRYADRIREIVRVVPAHAPAAEGALLGIDDPALGAPMP